MKTKENKTRNKRVCSDLKRLLPVLTAKTNTLPLRCILLPLLTAKTNTLPLRGFATPVTHGRMKDFYVESFRVTPGYSRLKNFLPGVNSKLFNLKLTFYSHYSCYSQLHIEIVAVYKRGLKKCVRVIYREMAGVTGVTGVNPLFG